MTEIKQVDDELQTELTCTGMVDCSEEAIDTDKIETEDEDIDVVPMP